MTPLESFNPSLLGSIDSLWFHKIVLSSERKTCLDKSPVEITSPSLSSSSCSSSESKPSSKSSSFGTTDYSDDDDDDEIVQDFTFAVHGSLPIILANHHKYKLYTKDEDDSKEMLGKEEGKNGIKDLTSIRPSLVSTPIRRRIKNRLKLERTISCKTLAELEQEEVKGFMDLGFSFEKDRLTPRMMSVIPGLQRLQLQDKDKDKGKDEEEQEEDNRMVQGEAKSKPYLSEAWLIKRPNSPLVRLRVSRPFTSANDMKKHLKLWAKTVAYSAIQDS